MHGCIEKPILSSRFASFDNWLRHMLWLTLSEHSSDQTWWIWKHLLSLYCTCEQGRREGVAYICWQTSPQQRKLVPPQLRLVECSVMICLLSYACYNYKTRAVGSTSKI